eukprot:g26246.t1
MVNRWRNAEVLKIFMMDELDEMEIEDNKKEDKIFNEGDKELMRTHGKKALQIVNKLHRQLGHPGNEKLVKALKDAKFPDEATRVPTLPTDCWFTLAEDDFLRYHDLDMALFHGNLRANCEKRYRAWTCTIHCSRYLSPVEASSVDHVGPVPEESKVHSRGMVMSQATSRKIGPALPPRGATHIARSTQWRPLSLWPCLLK